MAAVPTATFINSRRIATCNLIHPIGGQVAGIDRIFMDKGLERLEVPVPPEFEVALGYHDDAKLLSFFWEFGGLYCDDGVNVYTANRDVWEAWTGVPQVRCALEPFDLICPPADADRCLVLFTEYRTFAVGFYDLTVKHLHGPRERSEEPYGPARTRQRQQAAWTSLSSWLEKHHGGPPATHSVGEKAGG